MEETKKPLTIVVDLYAKRKAKVEDLRGKFPGRKIALVVTQRQDFYIASPQRAQWHAFKDAIIDKTRKRVAMENLATSCCLDPGPEAVKNLIETTDPALAETLSDKIARLGGYDDEAEFLDFQEP